MQIYAEENPIKQPEPMRKNETPKRTKIQHLQ